MLLLLWFVSPGERERNARVARLELGDAQERVSEVMGSPGARCSGSDLNHLSDSFPPGWPAASLATTLQVLAGETRDRWVYPLSSRRTADCAAADRQTELGFDEEGRLLWYVAIVGETPLRIPERFTPAAPEE